MTLEQIKNDYAVSVGFRDWEWLFVQTKDYDIFKMHENKVMKLYAMECLKLASENAIMLHESEYQKSKVNKLEFVYTHKNIAITTIDKESITNENNIIK